MNDRDTDGEEPELSADAGTADSATSGTHPRFQERRVAVEHENLQRRNKKLVAACVLAACALLAFAITRSPLLDIDEFAVEGASTLNPASIVTVSELAEGEPLLGLDLDLAADRLEILPSIASATVTKSWGGLVTITVVERQPAVQFRNGETWIVTAADGIVIAHAEQRWDGVPGIRGALFQTAPGRRVPAEVGVSLAVAAAMPSDVSVVVETITQTADSLLLDLYGGARIELGDARNLTEKFSSVRAFLGQVELRCVESINVQAPTVPVIVRSDSCSTG